MYGEHSTWNGGAGYQLLDRYARNLPGVERISISTNPGSAQAFVGGQKVTLQLRGTDAEYWQILEFDFLEGGPFNAQDVAEARFVAVINAATRDRFLAGDTAVGQTIEADGQRFRVVGVVPDVPAMRMIPFADIWVPLTTAKSDAYKSDDHGRPHGHRARVEPRRPFPAMQRGVQVASAPGASCRTPRTTSTSSRCSRRRSNGCAASCSARRDEEDVHVGAAVGGAPALVGLLFMLLPTVNLVNLNVSRIMERASEIGVRKAFGASSRTLVGQFVVENVVLTLIGAAVGFVLSFLVLRGAHRERDRPLRRVPPEPPGLPLRRGDRAVLRRVLGRVPGLADVAPQPGAGAEGSEPMIRHYLKLIWNRKRSNLLIMVEIFLSFLVVFGVDDHRPALRRHVPAARSGSRARTSGQ